MGTEIRRPIAPQVILSSLSLTQPVSIPSDTILTPKIGENRLKEQEHYIWFAVPKKKVSRSRKRMKTTVQKRIPLKKNIVFDPRTGEVTLKHRLPFNWKDYLPKIQ